MNSTTDHAPDSGNVPLGGIFILKWDDPGAGSIRAANAATVQLRNLSTGQSVTLPAEPANSGSNPVPRSPGLGYAWSIELGNEFGQGPLTAPFAFHVDSGSSGSSGSVGVTQPPAITVAVTLDQNNKPIHGEFTVAGSGFAPSKNIRVRVVDRVDPTNQVMISSGSSDAAGNFRATITVQSVAGRTYSFSATDERSDSNVTGVLWSNTVNLVSA